MRYKKPAILSILIVFIFKSGNAHDSIYETICKVHRRVNATKRVTFKESYKDDDGASLIRIKHRLQNFTKWEPMEICCEGYEPQEADSTTCVPVCRGDCLHSKCVRPNECTCEPGYRNVTNNLTKYRECVPVCSSDCHGGICVAPNVCECPTGYVTSKDEGTYGPQVCPQKAMCVSPGVCQCNNGYTMKTIPDWNNIGDNDWDSKNLVLPLLPRDIAVCIPSCNPECPENSSCVAPDKCECKTGYEKDPTLFTFRLVCVIACKHPCHNGRCVAPHKCVCHEGYEPHPILKEDWCEPKCQRACLNGMWTRPDNCECFPGYEKLNDDVSSFVCLPVCPGNCPNGNCVAPKQCSCKAGYHLDLLRIKETRVDKYGNYRQWQKVCRPSCKQDCPTGSTCIAPNRCRSETDQNRVVNTTVETQIVNSTVDCGDHGVPYEKNGACGCEYLLDGRNCTESGLCAIIFTDDENIVNLESISLRGSDSTASSDTVSWMFRRCPVKCRTLIRSKQIMDVVGKNPDYCYPLERLGANAGGVDLALRSSSITHGRENETIICLSTGETMCGTVESIMDNVVGIVVGTIVFVALIAGLIAAIYLVWRKSRKIGVFGGTSRSNGQSMEQMEIMESPLHTLDRPHV